MRPMLEARAPGKVVLMGDYVVLEGAPALAAALPQEACARFVQGSVAGEYTLRADNLGVSYTCSLVTHELQQAALDLAPQALKLAIRVLVRAYELSEGLLPGGALSIDTSAFFREGHKLGLGSSAATLVAVARVLTQASLPASATHAPSVQLTSLACLLELHRAWQAGHGSGLDVATSLAGGVVRYQTGLRSQTPVHAHHDEEELVKVVEAKSPSVRQQTRAEPTLADMPAASGPAWAVISVGGASSTKDALGALAALKASDEVTYWRHMEKLAHLSNAACEFWQLGEQTAFLPLVTQTRLVLQSLGSAMGWPVVTAPHEDVASRIEKIGGVYKPSGAGGGDIGVAFFGRANAVNGIARALRGSPYRLVAANQSRARRF